MTASPFAVAPASDGPTIPLRVLIDVTHFWPGGQSGGIKPALQEIVRWLGRLGGTEIEFVFVTNPVAEPIVATWMRPGDRTWRAADAPPDLAARAGCGLVYCPFGLTDWACPGIPTVSLIVDLLHRDFPASLEPVDLEHRARALERAVAVTDCFQVISDYTGRRLRDLAGIAPERMIRTYLPLQDRLAWPSPASAPAPAPYFLYPANAWAHKNHETLLVAYKLYRDAVGPGAWRLVLTGHPDARMARVRTVAAALGLDASVEFAGYVDDARLAGLWRDAGALVFPSLHEGFGVPLLEAMAAGVPILASDATALPEIAGDAARLCDARAPRLLAEGLRELASDTELRRRLIARGRERLNAFSAGAEFGRLWTAFRKTATATARFRQLGYHAVDGLTDPLAMFALPAGTRTLQFQTRPLGIARTAEFRAGDTSLGTFAIAAGVPTTGELAVPPRTRVVTLATPDASRLATTDPRTHGVLLGSLAARREDGITVQLLE